MLGLPSTTELERPIPKEYFYRNLELSTAVKDSFIHDIEMIFLVNEVRATTSNIEDGERVHEILVMRIELKARIVPTAAIEAINTANACKKIFVCIWDGEACLAVKMNKLVVGPWKPLQNLTLQMKAGTLDDLWDALASQIVYGDMGKTELFVEERFARDQKIESLRKEIARLDVKCRKEKQFGKKNELFAQVKKLKAQLAEIEKGI